MTAVELFTIITTEPKWYAGYCTAQNATNIKRRFEARQLTFDKLQHLFNHFGYHLEAEWVKVKIEKKLVAMPKGNLGMVSNIVKE